MRASLRLFVLSTTLSLLAACGGQDAPPPVVSKIEVALAEGRSATPAAGVDTGFVARATWSDMRTEDVTAKVAWTSSAPTVAIVSTEAGHEGEVHTLAAGSAVIEAVFENVRASATVMVGSPEVTTIELDTGDITLERRSSWDFHATASFTDGTSRDVTSEVAWNTSHAYTATVAAGLVYAAHVGSVVVSAELGGKKAESSVTVDCTYPEAPLYIQLFDVVPRVSWQAAYRADGSTGVLDLRDVYCELGEFAENPVKTIGVVVGAGWCPNCPDYDRASQDLAAAAEANGMLMIFAEVQDEAYRTSDSAYANEEINHLYPNGFGWRVGDTDSDPQMYFLNAPYISAFPSAFAVRVRDMKMIADRDFFPGVVPFDQIAQRPEQDWTNGFPFEDRCAEGDEEASEPNDSAATAATLEPGAPQHGGICASGYDFYKVEITGNWRLTLDFHQSVGDLDVYVWDPANNRPKMNGQTPIGSAGTSDREQFSYHGAEVIAVVNYQNSSGAYDLTLEAQ